MAQEVQRREYCARVPETSSSFLTILGIWGSRAERWAGRQKWLPRVNLLPKALHLNMPHVGAGTNPIWSAAVPSSSLRFSPCRILPAVCLGKPAHHALFPTFLISCTLNALKKEAVRHYTERIVNSKHPALPRQGIRGRTNKKSLFMAKYASDRIQFLRTAQPRGIAWVVDLWR